MTTAMMKQVSPILEIWRMVEGFMSRAVVNGDSCLLLYHGGLLVRSTVYSGSKENESAEEKYLSAIKDVYLFLNFNFFET